MDAVTDRPESGMAGLDPVARLLAPHIDALLWRPTRLGVDSAWYSHLPFAHWIVAATTPRRLVELGTHAGVSYSAFCEAVQRSRLDASCLAVDTWQGDEHAGFYGEEIYADLRNFHDARYGSFSQLFRGTFDEALAVVDDGSIDLLHIDGRHTYDDARHDFETWLPKLSDRGVVLFHDTCVRERGFGVWRLWAELTHDRPHFEFLHGYGLGVLCAGGLAPPAVRELCSLRDAAAIGQVRECFALLGERWALDSAQRRLEQAIADQRSHAERLSADFATLGAYAKTLEANAKAREARDPPPQRGELRAAMTRALTAEREQQTALARAIVAEQQRQAALERALAADQQRLISAEHASRAEQDIRALRARLDAITASRSWELATSLRTAASLVRGVRHRRTVPAPPVAESAAEPAPTPQALPPPEAEPATEPQPAPIVARRRPSVLFASGEPDTPGSIYRCDRYAAWAASAGWDARRKWVAEIDADDLRDTDLVILWRATWSKHVEGIIEHVRMFGGRIGLDLDDLMIRPDLAKVEYIDAIRSINWSETHVRDMFSSVANVLHRVDFATATTTELAAEMRGWQKAAYVLPNGFDDMTWQVSRNAARARAVGADDGLVRIGYASGSRTHQRDFAQAAGAVAAVLRERPQTRLVLFRRESDQEPLLSLDEFPELAKLAAQIEWRSLVQLDDLPQELARFDINLVPLQTGNPFVEAKSELKFFEAAIAGAATIASPTAPYRRAIIDGRTGLLASDANEWLAGLLRLVDDRALRQRIAREACGDVLWRFGPKRQEWHLARFLAQQQGGAVPASGAALAQAFALERATERPDAARLPPLGDTEIVFAQDRLAQAAVTVVIASYDYADYIQQALESVRHQTLPLLDLVVVDDCSPDTETMQQILDWVHVHAERFNRLIVVRHAVNGGLGATRNTGFAWAETPYVLPLDADNRLRPDCAERLLSAIDGNGAAYAYPRLQHFGADDRVTGGERYEPQRLIGGNYIDAMALVARWAWSAAGGYYVQRDAMGWEDYALWCRLAELGFWGQPVDQILAEYRVHADSMVNAITETTDNKRAMVAYVEARHPWLEILAREPYART